MALISLLTIISSTVLKLQVSQLTPSLRLRLPKHYRISSSVVLRPEPLRLLLHGEVQSVEGHSLHFRGRWWLYPRSPLHLLVR